MSSDKTDPESQTKSKTETDKQPDPAAGKVPAKARSEKIVEVALDPRLFAYRPDLAAQSLFGRVAAPRYAAGEPRQVHRASIALRKRPVASAPLETEALFGERLTVYDEQNGWAWVQLERDQYVGYLPTNALSRGLTKPTHWVRANGTFLYPAPDIKSPPIMHLSITSEVAVTETRDNFCRLEQGGYIISRHLSEIGVYLKDFVTVAERLIDSPYLWGGKTRIGIDCSGLVQTALQAAGIDAPRDSDLQLDQLGDSVDIPDPLDDLKRGDLIFWKGHVGLMIDAIMMVHANAHHMSVVAEPLPETAARIAKDSGPILAIKRLPSLTV